MGVEAIYLPKNRVNGKPKKDSPFYGKTVIKLIDKGSFGVVMDSETGEMIYAWKDELKDKGSD